MCTLNLNIPKWVLTKLNFIFIICPVLLFSFASTAQLPGQLPVNLKTFKAKAENTNKVKVFWTTAYEKDNGYFDIERSADGVIFTSIGRIPGVNHSGILTDYTFYDNNSFKGISFYRLKQVDVDGKFSYSPIERVRNSETDHSVDVYPNPAAGREFKINLLKNIQGSIDVTVYDQTGRLKLQQQFSDNNTITINHNLAAGTYHIKITAKEFTETRKLIIQ